MYAFLSLPEVFGVLFQLDWGRKPQAVFLLIAIVAALIDLGNSGSFWLPILGWLCYAMIVIVMGTLAISYLLAAILKTPGCEWRAIPDLIARIRGRKTSYHPCSVYLHKLDQWEQKRNSQ